jgi:hypothetical protein
MAQRVTIPIQLVRLSNSTVDLIQSCERKFQMEKLLEGGYTREESADTVLGSAYGVGVATYFITQDKDKSHFAAWMAYYPELETEKKNQNKMFNALQCSFAVIDNLLQDYELVSFNGKPAAELSFCLFTDKDYYFVGYIDIVLRNRWTGKYVVVDAKTTGLELLNLDPIYKNSGQLIGYSIVLDAIVGESQADYDVLYLVAQMGREFTPQIKVLTYPKTLLDRLNWFISLGLDIEKLERMKAINVYPKRGQNCLKYNRPCKFFGTCDYHSADVPKRKELDTNEYDFYFNLNELIDNHVERINR